MTSLVAQTVKRLPTMRETQVWSLGWEDLWRRKWQPTLVFLPWKSQGRRSLVGYSPWGCKESDMTEQLHFHFAWNIPLVSLIFLKRSLVFPILLFSSISFTDHLGRVSYLSLLVFGTLYSDGYIFPFSPLFFTSLIFSAICKPSSDNHFAFLHFFFLGMVLIITFCTMLQTSVHN